MQEEININKLHGDIKRYAQMADKDPKGTKGSGKLNSAYELNLFKDMVKRNGKQAELIRQVPNIKGVSIPNDNSKPEKLKEYEKNMTKHLKNSIENSKTLSEKYIVPETMDELD